ncbi:MAG: CHAT domain-containing tetratricopeptide repeat protein [Acidobacteriota bacterium]|nr:CHAT domain-containing tetratricopeptide repeat protein [Acidobacteriota bacterium]
MAGSRKPRDLALSDLIAGRYDSAITTLESAVVRQPGDAAALSDLAALYHERGQSWFQAEDYVASLEMADRSLALEPGLAEAIFNRAVALEDLFLDDDAMKAWRRSAELEHPSAWAAVASTHLARLTSASAFGQPPVRNRRGEAETSGGLEEITELRNLLNRKLLDQAATMARQGIHELDAGQSSRGGGLDSTLPGIMAHGAKRSWHNEVIFHHLASRNPTIADGQRKTAVALQNQLAERLDAVGQHGLAWAYRYNAMALARSLPVTPADLRIIEEAVRACLVQHRPRAALDFQAHLIATAERLGLGGEATSAQLDKARIEAALGQQAEAVTDFNRALELLEHVPQASRARLAALVDVARSAIGEGDDRAAEIAGEIGSGRTLDSLFRGPVDLKAQTDFDSRRGNAAAAESDLEQAVEEVERRRAKVAPGIYRISYLDEAWPVYERLVAFELHLARPEKALDALESFRARVLLDRMREASAPSNWSADAPRSTPTSHEICGRLPDHSVLVVYAVIDGRLVTWLLRPSGVEMSPRQPAWSTISALVTRLRGARGNQESIRQALEGLDSVLVAPWRSGISPGDRLIFVPARDLHGVPFAALLDRRTGRFLVEDHPSGVAASASEFVEAMERDRQISRRPLQRVLLVGDPKPDPDTSLPHLPGTAREIESLTSIYGGMETRVLTRERATSREVLKALASADLVHLAAHSVEDRKDPARSHFVLSPDAGGPESLSSSSILRLHLAHTRLIVLAACGTHVGPVSPSEGAQSLASAFLAVGVPAVVASLWNVDDEGTERLSVRLHEGLRRGADALASLRMAQLEELSRQGGRFDWTWAGFQVFGGVAQRGE